MLSIAFLLGGSPVKAQNVQQTANWESLERPYNDSVAANYAADVTTQPAAPPQADMPCNACNGGGCNNCFDELARPYADPCPRIYAEFTNFYDSFRNVSDGGLNNNFGTGYSGNIGGAIPGLEDSGLGWQAGASYGWYDWDGRQDLSTAAIGGAGAGANTRPTEGQQQTFITIGFFRRADCDRPLAFGLVHDWMINDNYGAFAQAVTLGQWRGQAEYCLSGRNSIGAWGTLRDQGDSKNILTPGGALLGTASYRSLNQVNFFWHHKFNPRGADGWTWVGCPSTQGRVDQTGNGIGLGGGGTLGTLLLGGAMRIPLNNNLAFTTSMQYMRPSAAAGNAASIEEAFSFSGGITYVPNRAARSTTVAGRKNAPYIPVANNGYFLTDSNVSAFMPF
jgi:hypothetical protein